MITDEIGSFLVGSGLATGEGVDVFYFDNVNTPDNALIIQSYPGLPPEHKPAQPTYYIEHPSVQITVRASEDGRRNLYKRAEAINRAVDGISNMYLEGVWYLHVRATSSPLSLPDDERDRPVYVLNFETAKYPSPTT